MKIAAPIWSLAFVSASVVAGVLFVHAEEKPAATTTPSKAEAAFRTEAVRGRVVWMAEAMERRIGLKSVPEAKERTLAIETVDGQVLPIFEDVRGRAFRVDSRLRGIDVELLVRRYDASPMLRVVGVFALEKGHKFELDYWCEICAIAMYELKECECCQGEIELRRRPVPKGP